MAVEIRRQFVATISVNLLGFSIGWGFSWANANYLDLQSPQTILTDGPLTSEEAAWFMSLVCAGGLTGNIIYLYILEKFGRKKPILFLSIPMILSWIFIVYAKNAYWLYASRILFGFAMSSFFVSSPVFTSEICSDSVRGTMNSLGFLMVSLGALVGFIAALSMDFRMQAASALVIPIVFILVFYFVPESPVFLYRMNKIEAADRAFEFYKGQNAVQEAQERMLDKNHERPVESGVSCSDFFGTRAARKGFAISIILVLLIQAGGVYTLQSYTTSIFDEAGSSLTPLQSSLLLCVVQMVANILTMFLIDRLGRKILYTASTTGTGLGMLTLALHHMYKDQLPNSNWVPIYVLSITFFIAQIGLALPTIITIDVLPAKIRNITMTIGSLIMWVFGFGMNFAYQYMLVEIQLHGCLIVFCIGCFMSTFYALIFIPETKGKPYEKVAELLS